MWHPRILVLQNHSNTPAGLIGEQLVAGGAVLDIVQALDGDPLPPTPAGYDGLLVLGGPMNALDDGNYPNLRVEAGLIRSFIDSGLPVMGICLGAQMMARALGAAVRRAAVPEIGFTRIDGLPAADDDPLLEGRRLPRLMHWHYDTFDLPPGASLLATNGVCPNQAFRYGPGQYAFQFHLEATPAIIRAWVAEFRETTGDPAGPIAFLEDEIALHAAAAEAFGRRIGDRWLAIVRRLRDPAAQVPLAAEA